MQSIQYTWQVHAHLLFPSFLGDGLRFFLRKSLRLFLSFCFSPSFLSFSVADSLFGCKNQTQPVGMYVLLIMLTLNVAIQNGKLISAEYLPPLQEQDLRAHMSFHTPAGLS